MRRAWLGLGGNLGDPQAAMTAALQAFAARDDTRVVAVSRVFRTPPWGRTDQPDFLNACAAIETALEPLELLDLGLATERGLKRERRERWGPRTIDIDLLAMEGVRIDEERLVLPHPRIRERAFVLVPLADIAPALEIEGGTVAGWLERLDPSGIEPLNEGRDWWRS